MAALQDQAGMIDTKRLGAQDENFKDAVEHGLMWTLIDAKVAERWPNIVDISQQALNAKAAQEPKPPSINNAPLSAATHICAATCIMDRNCARQCVARVLPIGQSGRALIFPVMAFRRIYLSGRAPTITFQI